MVDIQVISSVCQLKPGLDQVGDDKGEIVNSLFHHFRFRRDQWVLDRDINVCFYYASYMNIFSIVIRYARRLDLGEGEVQVIIYIDN